MFGLSQSEVNFTGARTISVLVIIAIIIGVIVAAPA